MSVQDLRVSFGEFEALRGLSIEVPPNAVLGVIGPAGSAKTTFLRALNRMNELSPGCRTRGRILLDGQDIYAPGMDSSELRRKVGMVFAMPLPLPMSVYDNICYGPRLAGTREKASLDELAERSLRAAFLWDEVKDRLGRSALRLSGGQQQRLCLARTLAMEPEVVLLDEPSSGLDPVSTAKIEDAIAVLKGKITFVLVTNNTKQAARVADVTAFFLMGELIEIGPTGKLFTNPADQRTDDYLTGRFG
ncbi:MAG: phosphate ABC transporter ATP-binding protein [Spirochaetaceae bacterium]|nr:phosphate ABC transporter ATP-binding protein [Spirochaetaceae bacterium]